jgi:hypothetical protein
MARIDLFSLGRLVVTARIERNQYRSRHNPYSESRDAFAQVAIPIFDKLQFRLADTNLGFPDVHVAGQRGFG